MKGTDHWFCTGEHTQPPSTRRYKAMEFREGSCVKGIVFHSKSLHKNRYNNQQKYNPMDNIYNKIRWQLSPTKPKIQVCEDKAPRPRTGMCRSKQRKQWASDEPENRRDIKITDRCWWVNLRTWQKLEGVLPDPAVSAAAAAASSLQERFDIKRAL